MTIELTARHRDYENQPIWEDAEICECCGKKIIDVWTVSSNGQTYSAIGRECMKKVAGFTHPDVFKKAEAAFFKAQREKAEQERIAELKVRAATTSDDELISMIRNHLPENKQAAWIELLGDINVRVNVIMNMAA